MGEDELYYLTMKSLFAFSLFFCSAESQMNDSDYDDRGWSVYEESIIRAEKSIALYKEIVNKALYCKFVQSKRSKFTFRFKKRRWMSHGMLKMGVTAKDHAGI